MSAGPFAAAVHVLATPEDVEAFLKDTLGKRIEALEAALGKLEKANEELAAQRSVRTYHSIVQDGAAELLTGLDTARAEARKLLTQRN